MPTIHSFARAIGARKSLFRSSSCTDPSPSPPRRCRRRRDNADWHIETPSRPAAGRAPRHPVAFDVEDLLRRQPIETLRTCATARSPPASSSAWQVSPVSHTGETQGWQGPRARARPGASRSIAGDRALGMVVRVAEHVEHHHAVGHRREDRAEAVLAVEALAHPRHRAIDRALRSLSGNRLGGAQHDVDAAEEPEPKRLLLRRLRRRPDRRRRLAKQLVDRDALGIARLGFFACSTSSGTITVRLQYEILSRWNGNQRGSSMISTGITGTARQGTNPNKASITRVNTFEREAPPRDRIASRARTMCGASTASPIILSANRPSRWRSCRRRRRGTAANRRACPGCGADRPAILASSRAPPARRDNGAAGHIRPEWWRRLRARTPNGRPAVAGRAAGGRLDAPSRSALGAADILAAVSVLITSILSHAAQARSAARIAGADSTFDGRRQFRCRSNRRPGTGWSTRWRRRGAGILCRRRREGGAALAHDLPRRQRVGRPATVATSSHSVFARLSRGTSSNRSPALMVTDRRPGNANSHSTVPFTTPMMGASARRRIDAEMAVDDGAELGRHLSFGTISATTRRHRQDHRVAGAERDLVRRRNRAPQQCRRRTRWRAAWPNCTCALRSPRKRSAGSIKARPSRRARSTAGRPCPRPPGLANDGAGRAALVSFGSVLSAARNSGRASRS